MKKINLRNLIIIGVIILVVLFIIFSIFQKKLVSNSKKDGELATLNPGMGLPPPSEGPSSTETPEIAIDECKTHSDCGAHQKGGNGIWIFPNCQKCVNGNCVFVSNVPCEDDKRYTARCDGKVLIREECDMNCNNEHMCAFKTGCIEYYRVDCGSSEALSGGDPQCYDVSCEEMGTIARCLAYGREGGTCTLPNGNVGVCMIGFNETLQCKHYDPEIP